MNRTIIEEQTFSADRERFGIEASRLDDILEGVFWALSREPSRGTQIDKDLWGIATLEWPNAPAFVVYYTFDPDSVYVKFLEPAEIDPD